MPGTHGARTVLGTVPTLTADQWRIVIELLYREQQNVQTIQQDKADTIGRSVNMGNYLEAYLSDVASLREDIQRHTGITA